MSPAAIDLLRAHLAAQLFKEPCPFIPPGMQRPFGHAADEWYRERALHLERAVAAIVAAAATKETL